nr:flavodoxin domain-containing protein [uncultured Aminipila sp.]
MQATLILYESNYGFTEMVAKNLSLILGPAKYCRASEFRGNGNGYDNVVICTPVYSQGADCNIIEYVSKNSDWIKQKNVILICTCLAVNMAHQYLKPLNAILGESIVLQAAIGGKLILNKLSSKDYAIIKRFCSKTGFSLKDYDLFDMHKLIELALNIKKIKDHSKNPVEPQLLREYIDDFITTHNTCTLATGHGDHIRATPIEYLYKNNCIYIFSEGGEKFANILLNPNISVCIYDAYKGMSELGGMQITGTAEIIDTKTDEYLSVLSYKGLDPDKIYSLPVALNLIKIHIKKVEFLWSEFSRLGYSTKQMYIFTSSCLY